MAWLKAQFADVNSTAAFRGSVYALVVAVSTALGTTQEQTSAWVTLAQAAVLVLAAVCTSWKSGGLAGILRGCLFTVAAAIFGVTSIYGLTNNEQVSSWMSIIAAVVTFLSLSNLKGLNGSTSNPTNEATIPQVTVLKQ